MKKFTKKQKKEMIEQVMNEFDFKKVHMAMEVVGWDWRDEGVPSVSRMMKEAELLLDKVLTEEEVNYVSTGGFTAYIEYDYLALSFTFEESCTELWETKA